MFSPLRQPRATKRVLDRPANGVTVDRFRKILERANCSVENVEFQGDIVVFDIVFMEDGGPCKALLTDRLADGTYLRCCLNAGVGGAFPLQQVNDLNKHSKFLKFYVIRNDVLFLENSVVLVGLSDSAVIANIEVFHDSVVYIIASNFAYAGMSA